MPTPWNTPCVCAVPTGLLLINMQSPHIPCNVMLSCPAVAWVLRLARLVHVVCCYSIRQQLQPFVWALAPFVHATVLDGVCGCGETDVVRQAGRHIYCGRLWLCMMLCK